VQVLVAVPDDAIAYYRSAHNCSENADCIMLRGRIVFWDAIKCSGQMSMEQKKQLTKAAQTTLDSMAIQSAS
jgi:predicted transposase YbfD/YdcC